VAQEGHLAAASSRWLATPQVRWKRSDAAPAVLCAAMQKIQHAAAHRSCWRCKAVRTQRYVSMAAPQGWPAPKMAERCVEGKAMGTVGGKGSEEPRRANQTRPARTTAR
jgi:hypothetical protein